MDSTKLVSVIMPCYDSEKFVSVAIKSVIAQTYSNWELIICDDSSKDRSREIIRAFCAIDRRIKLISNEHGKGAPGARNSCLDSASGTYIAFLDSDDAWLPDKLSNQLKFMSDNKFSFVYSYYEKVNEEGVLNGICKAPAFVDFGRMRFCNFIGCLTAVYNREEIGSFYQPDLKTRNDYALWLKIFRSNGDLKAHCLPEVTATYRENNYGLSSNKVTAIKYFWICLNRYGGLNVGSAFVFSFIYLLIMLLKKKLPRFYDFLVTKF